MAWDTSGAAWPQASPYTAAPISSAVMPLGAAQRAPQPPPQRKDVPMHLSEMQLFGAYVHLHRVRRGLSQVDLALRMGLPGPETVDAIEAGPGVGPLPIDVAQDLARFCGLTTSQMIGEVPPPGTRPRVVNNVVLGPRLHDLSTLPGLPAAQRETLVRIVEELARVLRETMGPRADGR